MKMKKLFTKVGALALVGALLLTGCGNTDDEVERSEASQSVTVANPLNPEDLGSSEVASSGSEELPSESKEPEKENTIGAAAPFITAQYFSNYIYGEGDSNFYAYTYINVPGVVGTEHNALRDSLHELYLGHVSNIDWFEDMVRDGISEGYADDFDNWYNEVFYSIDRCDAKILSFWINESSYAGGAHPNSYSIGYTYDVKSGKQIELKDIAADYNGLRDFVLAELEDMDESEDFFDGWQDTVKEEFQMNAVQFTLSNDTLHIMFNTYDLAPYVCGPVFLDVDYTANKNLFKNEYFAVSDLETVHLDVYYEDNIFSVDGNGDGKNEVLKFNLEPEYFEYDGYSYMDHLEGSIGYGSDVNSLQYVNLDYCYEICDAYVCETKGGKKYLLLELSQENDWHSLITYDLSNPDKGPVRTYDSELGALHGNVIGDPSNFVVERIHHVMGTFTVASRVYLADNGEIKLLTDEDSTIIYGYIDEGEYPFNRFYNEVLVDFKAKEHGTGKEVTVKAGTRLYPTLTNRVDSVTFQMEDGSLVDVIYSEFNEDEWTHYIDGRPEDEVLDNIIYAG